LGKEERLQGKLRKRAVFLALVLLQPVLLLSKTINVPRDYLTIKSAVAASRSGDVVEVEDGIYFEKNIIIDKDIIVKAKNLLGAIIYGTSNAYESIFVVRAKAEITGFVLNNSFDGIKQRGSPDVAWRGRDLVILNMRGTAILFNAEEGNVGSGRIDNIVIDHCGTAVGTNDANDISLRKALVLNCEAAFAGFDHLSFNVDESLLWNCIETIKRNIGGPARNPLPPRATNAVLIGPDVHLIETLTKDRGRVDVYQLLLSSVDSAERMRTRWGLDLARWEGVLKKNAADILMNLGDRRAAKAYYSEVLSLRMNEPGGETWLGAIASLARLAKEDGNPSAAREYYSQAIERIDRVVGELPFKYLQSGFFDDKIIFYESLLYELFQEQKKSPGRESVEAALRYSEKVKSIGLLKSLMESSETASPQRPTDFESKRAAITKEIARLQIRLSKPGIGEAERRGIIEKLEDAEDEYKSFLIQKRRNTSASKTPASAPLPLSRFRERLLGEDTALIEYFIGRKYAYGFIVTAAAIEMVSLPDPDSLNPLVENFLHFLTMENSKELIGTKGSRNLSETLIGLFQEALTPNIKKLIIVPDGLLNYLPFEVLVRREENGAGKPKSAGSQKWHYLIEDYDISYAPSAVCLVRLMERQSAEKKSGRDILIFANSGELGQERSSVIIPGFSTRLPFAEGEARKIGAHFNRTEKTILTGADATEDYLKSPTFPGYRIIHFATHGFIDERYWWRSALLLNAKPGSGEDGLVQPFEIMNLELDADLVVLSACRTGRGRQDRGEGLMSLANSFFISGANAVLSSLWTIDDKSSAFFMDRYYKYLCSGMAAGQALRKTKSDMLKSRYAHPKFWAPFVLSGDHTASIRPMDGDR